VNGDSRLPVQVTFGDPVTGVATACGWWARVAHNLTYTIRWYTVGICPSSMTNDPRYTYTLPNYWAPETNSSPVLPPPPPSPSPPENDHSFVFLGLNGVAAIGVVVAMCAGCILVIAGAIFVYLRCPRKKQQTKRHFDNVAPAPVGSLNSQPLDVVTDWK
jgi:hypothetical protein